MRYNRSTHRNGFIKEYSYVRPMNGYNTDDPNFPVHWNLIASFFSSDNTIPRELVRALIRQNKRMFQETPFHIGVRGDKNRKWLVSEGKDDRNCRVAFYDNDCNGDESDIDFTEL